MVKLSDIDLPVVFKNKLLFSPGTRNGWNITREEINKSIHNTEWSNKNRSIYFSHTNRDAQKWIGRVVNEHLINGELFGDLEIHDADLALKLGHGRAPMGISAEIKWPQIYNDPTNFMYRGFAMVPNPEVPETMINFSKNKEDGEFKTAKIVTPTDTLNNEADFARDPLGNLASPTPTSAVTSGETSETAGHVHTYSVDSLGNGETKNTINGSPHIHKIELFQVMEADGHNHTIPQVTRFEDKQEEFAEVTAMEAKRKELGMSLSQFYAAPRDPPSSSALSIFDASHTRNAMARFNQTKFLSENEKSKARRKILSATNKFGIKASANFSEESEENSNLMSAERGYANMENTEKTEKPVEETKEEEKEEVSEESKDSKEADFAAIKDKLEDLSARIATLEEKQAKFSEDEEESKEEEEAPAEEAEKAEEASEEPEAEEKSEESEEESKEESEESEAKKDANFSKVIDKLDKVADALNKAAPMSTAEFAGSPANKDDTVIDRLTKALS